MYTNKMASNYFYGAGNTIKVHNDMFPSTFRMLIVGQSGCGKTTLLMKLLLDKNMLNYDKLYVFAPSLYQKEYEVLKAGFDNELSKENILYLLNSGDLIDKTWKGEKPTIETVAIGLSMTQKHPSKITAEFHTNEDYIPKPEELKMDIRNLIVFDDIMMNRKQSTAESYYTRGRSANCDAIYLSQNYTRLPLHSIRTNANFQIFFKSSDLVIRQLYANFVNVDMQFKEFQKFCHEAWEKDYGFIVIDFFRNFKSGNKYRSTLELNTEF
jgi:hypothetical protein